MKRVLKLMVLLLAVAVLGVVSLGAETNWDDLFAGYEPLEIVANHTAEGDQGNNTAIDPNYTVDGLSYETDYTGSVGPERINLTLKAKAYIPTFISFVLSGNDWVDTVNIYRDDSWQSTTWSELVFAPEVGGYVNANWESVGYGGNLVPSLDEDLYIQGSDYLKATINTNTFFKYTVETSKLSSTSGSASLPIESSFKLNDGEWSGTTSAEETVIVDLTANSRQYGNHTIWHRFRVPYSNEYLAGVYEGTISFKIYTL